jgi:hypothetical protein
MQINGYPDSCYRNVQLYELIVEGFLVVHFQRVEVSVVL